MTVQPKHIFPNWLFAQMRRFWGLRSGPLPSVLVLITATLLATPPAIARFEQHTPGTSRNAFIFVHGLLGDKSTFVAKGGKTSWPALLGKDARPMRAGPPLSTYGSGYLLYETDANVFLSPKDISVRLTDSIVDAGIFDRYDNIFLICHSLGGIICKELFLHLQLRRSVDADKIAGIFLFAVPSQGNPQVRWLQYIASLAGVSNSVLEGLKGIDINPALDALEKNWGFAMGGRHDGRPYVYCAYEKKATPVAHVLPDATIVSQIFAATRCDEPSRPENENHFSIVKPDSQDHSVYDWLRGRVGTIQAHLKKSSARRAMPADVAIELTTTKPQFSVKEPIEFLVTVRQPSHLYCFVEDRTKRRAVVLYPAPNQEFKAMIPGPEPVTLNGSDFGYDSAAGFYDDEPGTTRFRCFASASPLQPREHAKWLVQHVVERKARGVHLAASMAEIEPRILELLAHGATEAATDVRVIPETARPTPVHLPKTP